MWCTCSLVYTACLVYLVCLVFWCALIVGGTAPGEEDFTGLIRRMYHSVSVVTGATILPQNGVSHNQN